MFLRSTYVDGQTYVYTRDMFASVPIKADI